MEQHSCVHMIGRHPEGTLIPAADGSEKQICVGGNQKCALHVVGGYTYICPFTSVGGKDNCPDYKARELDLTHFKDAWERYQNDDSYNDIGKLNLACWLGERTGFLIKEIERLREQNARLKQVCREALDCLTDDDPYPGETHERVMKALKETTET